MTVGVGVAVAVAVAVVVAWAKVIVRARDEVVAKD